MSELWCIHVHGPDSVIAQPDRETALRRAHAWNSVWLLKMCADMHPHDPVLWAVPAPWPHSAAAHAASLASHGGEPSEVC